MKTLFVVLLFLLTSCSFAVAETYILEFGYPVSGEVNADGFSLFERVGDGKVTTIEEIPVSARSAEFDIASLDTCKTFFMAKYSLANNDTQKLYGDYSNTFGLCPDRPLPPPIEFPVDDDDTIIEITIRKKQ